MNNGVGETREQLLALAESRGYRVTEHQLARWHREGLLPRPKQRSLGRGRGTQTVYRSGTGQQLLRLCEIHLDGKEKRLLYVAWRLWWEGYEVSLKSVRHFLRRVAASLEKELDSLIDPDTGEVSEARWEKWMKSSHEGRLARPVGKMRRRLGSDLMPALMSIMLEVPLGLYQAHPVSGLEDAAEDDSDTGIVGRALGLDRGASGRRSSGAARLVTDMDITLAEGSQLFREHSLSEVPDAATDTDLSKSRVQVRLMLLSIEIIGLLSAETPQAEGAELRELAKDFRQMEPADQAIVMLNWAMWRLWGPPGMREMMDFHHEELQLAVHQVRELSGM